MLTNISSRCILSELVVSFIVQTETSCTHTEHNTNSNTATNIK